MIIDQQLIIPSIFQKKFEFFKDIDFVYNHLRLCCPSIILSSQVQKSEKQSKCKKISSVFYDGFGHDLF